MTQECDRCKEPTDITTMSWFNTEMICGLCEAKERRHSALKKAKAAIYGAKRNGDLNNIGIGKPNNL